MKAELIGVFGNDLMIVNAARVSFANHSESFTEKDQKLIRYLAKNSHISPFFHPQIQFRLQMPIWMAREWFRHEVGFARNEVSRRYISTTPTIWMPENLWQKNPQGNKQGHADVEIDMADEIKKLWEDHNQLTIDMYEDMIGMGMAPEVARGILPVNSETEFIETGSLAAYARLVKLRNTETANDDIRIFANMVGAMIEPHFPCGWKELMDA